MISDNLIFKKFISTYKEIMSNARDYILNPIVVAYWDISCGYVLLSYIAHIMMVAFMLSNPFYFVIESIFVV